MTNLEEFRKRLVTEFLLTIGEEPSRPGLVDTPQRVVETWSHLFSGYKQDVDSLFTVFEEDGFDEMVVLKDIEFVSHCEHHLMPFSGRAHIGYLPASGRVLGISKLARLLECFARRLQIQERIGAQVTDALMRKLKPIGCGCILEASHSCISCRGIAKQNAKMITSSMRGVFLQPQVKNEFLQLVGY